MVISISSSEEVEDGWQATTAKPNRIMIRLEKAKDGDAFMMFKFSSFKTPLIILPRIRLYTAKTKDFSSLHEPIHNSIILSFTILSFKIQSFSFSLIIRVLRRVEEIDIYMRNIVLVLRISLQLFPNRRVNEGLPVGVSCFLIFMGSHVHKVRHF